MANTVEDAIKEIQVVLRSVPGIRKAPNYPTDSILEFPFIMGYPGNGTLDFGPVPNMQGLHNLVFELHVARKDLERDVEKAIPYVDSIPTALLAALRDSEFTALQTFGTISYDFGPLTWGGIETLGFVFTVNDVKIHSTVS